MYKIEPLKKERLKRRKRNSIELIGWPYFLILFSLIVVPIILIVFYAITDDVKGLYFEFTFKYFGMFFREATFIRVMRDSIFLALITTLISLLIGYPLAFIISRQEPKKQSLLILLVTAPMWVNMLIRVLAWKQIFEMISPVLIGSNFAVVVGMVYVFLPFMVLPIYTVLSKIDPLLYEASADLGSNSVLTFIKVTLPLSLGGVLSGITMVLLPAATTIVIPKILGEGKYLIGNLIEDRFLKAGNWSYGSAIAIVLAVIIMLMVFLTKKFDRNKGGEAYEKE